MLIAQNIFLSLSSFINTKKRRFVARLSFQGKGWIRHRALPSRILLVSQSRIPRKSNQLRDPGLQTRDSLDERLIFCEGKHNPSSWCNCCCYFSCTSARRNLAPTRVNPLGTLMASSPMSESISSHGCSFFIHLSICLTLNFLLHYFTFPEFGCICNIHNKCT